jgi:hypothetical protein
MSEISGNECRSRLGWVIASRQFQRDNNIMKDLIIVWVGIKYSNISNVIHNAIASIKNGMCVFEWRIPVNSNILSAKVLLPWSICAMIQKFLILSAGYSAIKIFCKQNKN